MVSTILLSAGKFHSTLDNSGLCRTQEKQWLHRFEEIVSLHYADLLGPVEMPLMLRLLLYAVVDVSM